MTNTRRQIAIGALVAAAICLGANSDAGVRPAFAAADLGTAKPAHLVLCRPSVRALAPDRVVFVLSGDCARVAKVFVDVRNGVLDGALDAAGAVIARLKQM